MKEFILSEVTVFDIFFVFFRYARKERSIWIKPGRTEEWWKNLESSEMSPDE